MMEFCVDIRPHGKERPRMGKWGTYTPKKTIDNEKAISLAFRSSGLQKMDCEYIKVHIIAIFSPNKSETKKKREEQLQGIPYTKKPDIDNIFKEVLDALNGVAWNDDANVVSLSGVKKYGEKDKLVIQIGEYV